MVEKNLRQFRITLVTGGQAKEIHIGAVEIPVALFADQDALQGRLQFIHGSRLAADRRFHVPANSSNQPLEDREKEVFFGLEIIECSAFAYSGTFCDVLQCYG